MNIDNEKMRFAARLKQALTEANYPSSPTYLATQFNHRFSGTPISVQAANNWLTGKSIPNQDKLAILAIWLNKSAQWLRFGDASSDLIQSIPDSVKDELEYIFKIKRLTLHQQQIVKSLIDEFLNL